MRSSHFVPPHQPVLDGSVLFIEDIGEPAYKIDRMLTQMKSAGIFNNIKGVAVGSFIECENEFYIDEILLDIFGHLDIPIIYGVQAGHGIVNHALYMGLNVFMDTEFKTLNWT